VKFKTIFNKIALILFCRRSGEREGNISLFFNEIVIAKFGENSYIFFCIRHGMKAALLQGASGRVRRRSVNKEAVLKRGIFRLAFLLEENIRRVRTS